MGDRTAPVQTLNIGPKMCRRPKTAICFTREMATNFPTAIGATLKLTRCERASNHEKNGTRTTFLAGRGAELFTPNGHGGTFFNANASVEPRGTARPTLVLDRREMHGIV
jgi:hypothetical protein